MTSIGDIQHEVARARSDVRADFEALGRELGRDEHEYAPFIAAGAGLLGILLGLGGPKWIKRIVVLGAIGGIAAVIANKNWSSGV